MNFAQVQALECSLFYIQQRVKDSKNYKILWETSGGKLFTANTFRVDDDVPYFINENGTSLSKEYFDNDDAYKNITNTVRNQFVMNLQGNTIKRFYDHPEILLSALVKLLSSPELPELSLGTPVFTNVKYWESNTEVPFYLPKNGEQFRAVSLVTD